MQQVSRTFEHSRSIKPRLKPHYLEGYGSKSIGEPDWRPHPLNALSHRDTQQHSTKGGTGLDWYSSVRCPPPLPPREKRQTVHEDTTSDIKKEREHVKTKEPLLRRESAASSKPITLYKYEEEDNDRYYYMKPFELTLRRAVGAKKKVYCKRNGIPIASLGDKTYQVPEYSRDFHKHGSTRPVTSFGGVTRSVPDTFIPLQDLPLRPRPTFEARRKVFEKTHEIQEVVVLDTWKPAPALVASFQLPLMASHLLH